MLHNTSSSTTTAEKLLYDYAVEIVSNSRTHISVFDIFITINIFQCAKAALKELGNTPYDYFKSYQTAQILLHSLSQQVNSPSDKEILIRCNKYIIIYMKLIKINSTFFILPRSRCS